MTPSGDTPTSVSENQSLEASGPRESRRNRKRILFGLLAAVVVAGLAVGITASKDSSSRAGVIVNGCDFGAQGGDSWGKVNCPGAQLQNVNIGSVVRGNKQFNLNGATFGCVGGSTGSPCSDLSGASLEDLNLDGDKFIRAKLIGANLRNTKMNSRRICDCRFYPDDYSDYNTVAADFTGADLTDADLTGATYDSSTKFTDVIWKNTTCSGGGNSDSFTPKTCVGH
jgi:uncharacterized protein YjbI with pentapeptide repeats